MRRPRRPQGADPRRDRRALPAPVPHRGKPNAPYLIPLVLRCLAEVKGMDPGELAAAIRANGETVFGAW
nr:hypothetical protein GCM10020093_063210 [Planobispora longispora]